MGEGRAKAVVEEGDKDMGKARTVEESIWRKERENVRVAKKERKKVMVEGEGEGGVEEWGGEGEDGVGEGGAGVILFLRKLMPAFHRNF